MHLYIYYIHVYIYMYTYRHIDIYTCIHICVYIYKYIRIYIYTTIHSYISTYVHLCLHTFIHWCIYIYIHCPSSWPAQTETSDFCKAAIQRCVPVSCIKCLWKRTCTDICMTSSTCHLSVSLLIHVSPRPLMLAQSPYFGSMHSYAHCV
jgi:hypothetical protein